VIIPDINLLIYAYNRDAPHHDAARRWWEAALGAPETVGLPWAVALGFLRLMTSRHVLERPWEAAEILEVIRAWWDRPQVLVLQAGPRHLDLLATFARARLLVSSLTTDAHLAALAIENQAVLCTNDADFDRFPGLRHANPLA
jgi:uncharacterized protein